MSVISKAELGHKFFLNHKWPTLGRSGTERYEAEKAAWIAAHPEATSQEYEQAIREIASRLNY